MAIVRKFVEQTRARGSREVGSLAEVLNLLRSQGEDVPPIDINGVASLLGLKIIYEAMENDISGFLELRSGGWVVGVNSLHSHVRQRFTIAHEVAHYVLHRRMRQEFRDLTFTRRAMGRDMMEKEADKFAAALLMPDFRVKENVQGGITNVNELAQVFQVSAIAMKFRLVEMGYTVG